MVETAVSLVCVALLPSAWLWLRALMLQEVRVDAPDDPNSNTVAKAEFLRLLTGARKELLLQDDGGPTEGSIYESPEVVEAIRKKIDENQKFKIEALFSNPESTLFVQEFGGTDPHPRVAIRYRPDRAVIHTKIADRRKAYVSCHQPGSSVRNYKVIECPTGPLAWLVRRHTRKVVLGQYLSDFETHAS